MLDRIVACAASVVTRTGPPRIFTELGRHPRLFRAWLPFGGALLLRGELARADTELVVLRTAWNCRCRYEWVQHAPMAARAGLSAAQVEAIPDGDADVFSERQRCLLRATDELHDQRRLDPDTAALLGDFLGERQLIELCILVGHYEMLAMLLNSRAVAPEPAALRRLEGGAAAVAANWRQ